MSTMDQYQTETQLLCSFLFQQAIFIVILATTPKGSLLRYVALPIMLWNAWTASRPVQPINYISINLIGHCVCMVWVAFTHLLTDPKDGRDLAGPDADGKPPTLISRLLGASNLTLFPRGINFPHQAKNIPPFPQYYAEGVSRGRFLIREFSIALWQYLVLDFVTVLAMEDAWKQKENGVVPFTGFEWDLPLTRWVQLIWAHFITWFIVMRVAIGSYYRFFAIPYVACGLGPASGCPPMFGNMADAYTLRNFWGKFWHQMLRAPMTGVSNFISRDVLGLPRPSIIERYFNVFLVFFLSATLHVSTDVLKGVPARQSGTYTFFLSFTLGYMIEDGVQALWKHLYGPQPTGGSPPLWQRIIGYCWVIGWLGFFSIPFFGTSWGSPERQVVMVPFSFVETVGFSVASGALLTGAVVLKVVFKIEI